MSLVQVSNNESVQPQTRLTAECGEFHLLGWVAEEGVVLVRPVSDNEGFVALPASAFGLMVTA